MEAVVLDLVARPSPTKTPTRPRAGGRQGASAGSFEDVLRELDRAGQPVAKGRGGSPRTEGSQPRSGAKGEPATDRAQGPQAPGDEPDGDGEMPAREAETSLEAGLPPGVGAALLAGAAPASTEALGVGGHPGGGAVSSAGTGELEGLLPATVPLSGSPAAAADPALAGLTPSEPAGGPEGMLGEAPVTDGTQPPSTILEGQSVPGPEEGLPVADLEAAGEGVTRLDGSRGGRGPNPGLEEGLAAQVEARAAQGRPAPSGQAPRTRTEAANTPRPGAEGTGLDNRTGATAHQALQGQGASSSQSAADLPHGAGEGVSEEAGRSLRELLEATGFRVEEASAPGRPATAEAGHPAEPGPGFDLEPGANSTPAGTTTQGSAVVGSPGDAPFAEIVSEAASAASEPRAAAGAASTPLTQVNDLVLKRLHELRSPGSEELHLELEPKELGSLKIRLELRGDGVKAHFVVERPVVQAMLDRAMAELRQSLVGQGYQVEELSVALQGEDGREGREPLGDRGRGQGRARGLEGGAVETGGAEVAPPTWTPWLGTGRIDIRV